MRLHPRIGRDSNSNNGGSCAMYPTDTAPDTYPHGNRRGVAIQGITADDGTEAQFTNLTSAESGVWVPDNVIFRGAAQLAAKRVLQVFGR